MSEQERRLRPDAQSDYPLAGSDAGLRRPIFEVRSPAKVNWWLRVLDRRPDGYHNIETVFQRLDFCDDLRIQMLLAGADDSLPRMDIEGFPASLALEDNLIYRAWRGYNDLLEHPPGLHYLVHVNKRIPYGGGLGGGSSNAAAVLHVLAKLSGSRHDPDELHNLAARLGADVPFFLRPESLALGRGRGTDLTPLPEFKKPLKVLVALAPYEVPTGGAYGRLSSVERPEPAAGQFDALVEGLVEGDVEKVAQNMRNDFELVAGQAFYDLKAAALGCGFPGVILSGSGASAIVLLPETESARNLLLLKQMCPAWKFVAAQSCGSFPIVVSD